MRGLNNVAKETLRDAGLTQADWARRCYGPDATGEWFGDTCGCPDDRCIGSHHSTRYDCDCLPALLQSAAAHNISHT